MHKLDELVHLVKKWRKLSESVKLDEMVKLVKIVEQDRIHK